jgi:hypothetical protein
MRFQFRESQKEIQDGTSITINHFQYAILNRIENWSLKIENWLFGSRPKARS